MSTGSSSMGFFYDLIVSPGKAIYSLSRREPGYGGFAVLLFACLSATSARILITGSAAGMAVFSLTWGLTARFLIIVLALLFAAAFYHFFAGAAGGRGSALKLFAALPYCSLPFVFSCPAVLISRAFAPGAGWLIPVFLMLIFLLWAVYIQFQTISYFYGMSKADALAVFMLPWVIISAVSVLVPVIIGTGLFILIL